MVVTHHGSEFRRDVPGRPSGVKHKNEIAFALDLFAVLADP
jgi:hypothetical protein